MRRYLADKWILKIFQKNNSDMNDFSIIMLIRFLIFLKYFIIYFTKLNFNLMGNEQGKSSSGKKKVKRKLKKKSIYKPPPGNLGQEIAD